MRRERERQRAARVLVERLHEGPRHHRRGEREPAPALRAEQEVGVARAVVGAVEVRPRILQLLHLGAEQRLRRQPRRTLARIDLRQHGVVRGSQADDRRHRPPVGVLGLDMEADLAAGDRRLGVGRQRDLQPPVRTAVDEALGLRTTGAVVHGDAQDARRRLRGTQGHDGRLALFERDRCEGEFLLAHVEADGGIGGLRRADDHAHRTIGLVHRGRCAQREALGLHLRQRDRVLDARRLREHGAVGPPGLRRERQAPAALVQALERRDLGALVVDDGACDVGGFLTHRLGFEVDTARHAGNQLTALGIEREVHALQHDRQRLRGRLGDAFIGDAQGQRAHAVADGLRQVERHGYATECVGAVVLAVDLVAVEPRDGGHEGVGRDAAFGAAALERGVDAVTRAVRLAEELQIGAQTRCAVGTHVDLALGLGRAEPRERGDDLVLPADLIVGDLPVEGRDAIERTRAHLVHDLTASGLHDEHALGGLLVADRHAVERVQHHGAREDDLARLVERLVRTDVREVALVLAQPHAARRRARAVLGCGLRFGEVVEVDVSVRRRKPGGRRRNVVVAARGGPKGDTERGKQQRRDGGQGTQGEHGASSGGCLRGQPIRDPVCQSGRGGRAAPLERTHVHHVDEIPECLAAVLARGEVCLGTRASFALQTAVGERGEFEVVEVRCEGHGIRVSVRGCVHGRSSRPVGGAPRVDPYTDPLSARPSRSRARFNSGPMEFSRKPRTRATAR